MRRQYRRAMLVAGAALGLGLIAGPLPAQGHFGHFGGHLAHLGGRFGHFGGPFGRFGGPFGQRFIVIRRDRGFFDGGPFFFREEPFFPFSFFQQEPFFVREDLLFDGRRGHHFFRNEPFFRRRFFHEGPFFVHEEPFFGSHHWH